MSALSCSQGKGVGRARGRSSERDPALCPGRVSLSPHLLPLESALWTLSLKVSAKARLPGRVPARVGSGQILLSPQGSAPALNHQNWGVGSRVQPIRRFGSSPHTHFGDKKGVKVLNIKLSKTLPLPTHLSGGPTAGVLCGLWRVTWKHPQQKPAPHTPRAKYLRGWGRRLSPVEVLRSNLLQPLVTRAEKVYLGLRSAPASLPLLRLPDPPPRTPHHSDTQSPAPVPTLTDTGSLSCAMCAGRKDPQSLHPLPTPSGQAAQGQSSGQRSQRQTVQ